MKYSTSNLPLPDAPPAGNHLALAVPLVVDDGPAAPPRFSSSGGGKETGEHVRNVMMVQGGGNGGRSTSSRDNPSSDHDAVDKKSFIVDSGASDHATGDLTLLSYLEYTTNNNMCLCTANGSILDIHGRGTVQHENITLQGVLYAPGLTVNVVSVSKLIGELDYSVEFTRTSCFIRDADTGDLVGKAHLVNGLFELDFLMAPRT